MDTDFISLNKLLLEAYNIQKKEVNSNSNLEIVACLGADVIGYLVLNKLYDSVCGIYYGYINYVCVKEEYKNKGIASLMFERLFEICKRNNISYLELTSNKQRVVAHHLYEKLGFNIRDTYVFRKEIL